MLTVNNLSVALGRGKSRHEVVSNVSFSVSEGEGFGLVGSSGSGKSTILRALAGIVRPDRGTIDVSGRAIDGSYRSIRAAGMALVFQDASSALNPHHTIDEIISEPLDIRGERHVRERVAAALDDVGLDHGHLYRFPHELSGGQRQRVAIARAIVVNPRLLLLDEPTSALDVSIQADVLDLITRLKRDRNLTVVMVGHDLAAVAHVCDRIAVLHDRQIVETCTRDQLRRRRVHHPITQALVNASA